MRVRRHVHKPRRRPALDASAQLSEACEMDRNVPHATWTDYRLNHRLTTEDKQLEDRVLQLHGGELPLVTLSIDRPTSPVRKADQTPSILSHR